MSKNEPGRYSPPGTNLERELTIRDAQVRSLQAEVRRLQQHVPKDVLKGQRRPTRREKMNGKGVSHANPG